MSGYRDADLQFRQVSGPLSYAADAEGPVLHVTVASGGRVLGYLRACDDHGAAGFVSATAAGVDGVNARGYWTVALREPRARELPPSAALHELTARGGHRVGVVVPGSEVSTATLADLRVLAAHVGSG